jgi:hypothetical protein
LFPSVLHAGRLMVLLMDWLNVGLELYPALMVLGEA